MEAPHNRTNHLPFKGKSKSVNEIFCAAEQNSEVAAKFFRYKQSTRLTTDTKWLKLIKLN
jgi:hypothetical protein